jgi:hypothetical protein
MKRSWRVCVFWFCVAVVPSTVFAQSGSVVLSGSVSKTVALSLSPNAEHTRAELSAVEIGGVLRLMISGSEVSSLQVPILIRSNTSYNIIASAESQTAELTQLSILTIEPGGRLVAANAVTGASAVEEKLSDATVPFTIFSGPRVSLGGGLKSPDNALKVTLLISVRPKVEKESWTMNLTLQTETP